MNDIATDNYNIVAETKKRYMTPQVAIDDIVEFFHGQSEALHIWLYAMGQPETWDTSRDHLMKNVAGISERKMRPAVAHLKKIGLLETCPNQNKNKEINGSRFVFYGLEYRVKNTDKLKTPGAQSGTLAYAEKTRRATNDAETITVIKPVEKKQQMVPQKNAESHERRRDDHCDLTKVHQCYKNTNVSYEYTRTDEKSKLTSKEILDNKIPPCPPGVILPADDDETGHRDLFLQHFDGLHTFQTFDDSTDKDKSLARITHQLDPKLNYLNENGAGVFMAINETDGKGRAAKNITRVRAVFADFDGSPLAPVWRFNPHMVVESSPGKFHAYWGVHDVPLEGFRQLQESIARILNSDPVVKDLPRVMRVPGYYHCKGAGFMTKIVYKSNRALCTFAELTAMFPPEQKKQWSAAKFVDHSQESNKSQFRGAYGTTEGDRNNSLMRCIGGMIKRKLDYDMIVEEAFKHGRACTPPLSDAEINKTIKSAMRYK